MFGRDKAVDPMAEAAKILAASKSAHPPATTEFAREMITDKPTHAPAPERVPSRAQAKPAAAPAHATPHVPTSDPEVVQAIERMLGRLSASGPKALDPRQKAALLKSLTPEQQATIAKLADYVPSGQKLGIIIFAIFIALQVIPSIIGALIGR